MAHCKPTSISEKVIACRFQAVNKRQVVSENACHVILPEREDGNEENESHYSDNGDNSDPHTCIRPSSHGHVT